MSSGQVIGDVQGVSLTAVRFGTKPCLFALSKSECRFAAGRLRFGTGYEESELVFGACGNPAGVKPVCRRPGADGPFDRIPCDRAIEGAEQFPE